MELTDGDRQAVRVCAVAMLRKTAAKDHQGAHKIGGMVYARYGTGGVGLPMAL
ncbi:hypothetical protein [Streptomyces sp. H39-C1]|uniref:hypothetical protein n=1 Tax=Streptomyces sp. H39-C1 TaxID=3004355 RepID=UPI0022AEAE65|nr:hypothetical protein [Streptomyces sp. H39-C1]MCZ4098073.1 hypothetical protein [Streptomyces sp. H39-C1]